MKYLHLLLLAALAAPACRAGEPPETNGLAPQLQSIERATQGRLGVALVDRGGRLLAQHRGDERFAFCSTFKLFLAGMALDGSRAGSWALDERLPVAKSDLVPHSPVLGEHMDQGSIAVRDAARAAVMVSDNGAANVLLRRMGGLAAFNRWMRSHGDPVIRLDRFETELNENRPGDPRDTSTPRQMAASAAQLIFGEWLRPEDRDLLRTWLVESRSGLARIRGGLPTGWRAGDKTGSCAEKGRESYNDIAFIEPDGASGQGYILAAYLDSPKGKADDANGAIAKVAAESAELIRGRRSAP